ncbi:hypothetical protein [Pedobacter insulae]|uniref:Uncharacterized protein n=1 Tax=Pedobacter insulae TaxID=414048 RepID=A0A1I2ZA36_9SPHI|nr:hypothetical protein [Pedobacter insulae]SFH34768.1 hypothetical protein SAMN04489864_109104 [Pedobacter insulae]
MKIKYLILSALCFSLTLSCKKTDKIDLPPPINLNSQKQATNPKNPYTVINMRKAFAKLLIGDVQLIRNDKASFVKGKVMFTEGKQALGINKQLNTEQSETITQNGITATHYYIKFIPRDEADYNKLKVDSNLVIYPFPLDNEIATYSGSYRDPEVAPGVPTYQYAAVPIAYVLPDVPYIKLEDLYLPNEQDKNSLVTVNGTGGSSYTVTVQQLVQQALCDGEGPIDPPVVSVTKANNENLNSSSQSLNSNRNIVQSSSYKLPVISLLPPPDEDPCDGSSSGGPYPPDDEFRNGENWRPNGRITLYDDVKKQTIGVEGIKVRARRWFTTYTGITDAAGYYAVDGWYTRPANYWLDFERYDFSVNDHHGGPREISGPKIEAAWNVDFTGYDKFCGEIFRAAHHYYYRDIQGLRRPPQNSFWETQVKLAAFDWYLNSDNGSMWAGRNDLLGSLIHIYHPQQNSMDTYATTIHELAHAVHWDMSDRVVGAALTNYGLTELRVCETWARGVQWVLTKMEYPEYVGGAPSADYTNIVIDMIDDEVPTYPNPGSNRGHNGALDQVEGYSIVQIQNALCNQTSWNGWKNNIKNLYINGTENNLDALFTNWGNF